MKQYCLGCEKRKYKCFRKNLPEKAREQQSGQEKFQIIYQNYFLSIEVIMKMFKCQSKDFTDFEAKCN